MSTALAVIPGRELSESFVFRGRTLTEAQLADDKDATLQEMRDEAKKTAFPCVSSGRASAELTITTQAG